MNLATLNSDFVQVAIGALIPVVLFFLAWLLREQLGFFRRTVKWTELSAFGGSYKGGNEHMVSWNHVFIKVSRGKDAVKNLDIHCHSNISNWQIEPAITGAELKIKEDDCILHIPSIESGKYVIQLIGLDYGLGRISGMISSNAKCIKGHTEEQSFETWVTILRSFPVLLSLLILISSIFSLLVGLSS